MTFLNRHRSRIRPVGPFAPSSLFFGGIPGAWYDPTDLSTMFQDSAGTTPVTAVEQPVGLILDKSQGLALGAELVTNGTFDVNLNGWTLSGTPSPTWSASGIVLTSTGAFFTRADQSFSTTVGRTYRLTFDVVTGSGSLAVKIGTSNGASDVLLIPNMTTAGARSFVFVAASATTYIRLENGSTASPVMDNVSIRELAGNHASQSTAASRPTYRARYNLLTYSEDFGNAAWQKNDGATVTTDAVLAPDGTLTADALNIGALNISRVQQPLGALTTATMSYSVWMRVASGTEQIRFGDATAPTTVTVTSVWQRFVVVANITGTAPNLTIRNDVAGGAKTIYAWGAQLLTAADVTATGNAYQRIAAATVYDTSPIFRPYLAFDGLDDSLSTAAINFTSTDKMTVFAGVTKLSGATTAVLAGTGTGNGSFELFAPRAVNDTQSYGFAQRTTAPTEAIYGVGFPSPDVAVLTGTSNIGAPLVTLRRNGTTIASNAAAIPAGNYGNFAMVLGQRSGGGLIYNGRLFSLIVRGAASSVTEIADTELWVNARTGAF